MSADDPFAKLKDITPKRESVDIREEDSRTVIKPLPEVAKAAAIQYDKSKGDTPIVTASGKGAIAEQILAIAYERGIKVREDADLVEMLSLIEVDSPIPLEAFAAVAEILAYVYQANNALKPKRD